MIIDNKHLRKIFFNFAKELFPINRSLSGKGNIRTLNLIKKFLPKIKILKFKSRQRIYDWVIPDEWNINNSYIKNIKTKKKYACFKKNNLHIVSYSVPIKKILDKKDLVKKIYTIKSKPKAIPYVTSYYKKDWGFCMEYDKFKRLPKGKYEVLIDSSLKKGNLVIGENKIKGKFKKEFLFSTNICHPSMANNELSGILMCTALGNYIEKYHPKPNFTYNFVFIPETIGSLTYIKKNYKNLKKNVIGGFVISCVGDDKVFTHIESPYGNNFSDKILNVAFKNIKNKKKFSFLNRGSDERQYCSPKINLPVCGFSRTKYHEFKEYHTSEDNLKILSFKGMVKTFKLFTKIIDTIEFGLFPVIKTSGEPFLTKYGMYRTLAKDSIKRPTKNILNFLAYSNGKNSVFDIALKCDLDLNQVSILTKILKKNKLINFKKM